MRKSGVFRCLVIYHSHFEFAIYSYLSKLTLFDSFTQSFHEVGSWLIHNQIGVVTLPGKVTRVGLGWRQGWHVCPYESSHTTVKCEHQVMSVKLTEAQDSLNEATQTKGTANKFLLVNFDHRMSLSTTCEFIQHLKSGKILVFPATD